MTDKPRGIVISIGMLLLIPVSVAVAWVILDLPVSSDLVLPIAGLLAAVALGTAVTYCMGNIAKVGRRYPKLIPVVVSELFTKDRAPVTVTLKLILFGERLSEEYAEALTIYAQEGVRNGVGTITLDELLFDQDKRVELKGQVVEKLHRKFDMLDHALSYDVPFYDSISRYEIDVALDIIEVPPEQLSLTKQMFDAPEMETYRAEKWTEWLLTAIEKAQMSLDPEALPSFMEALRLLISSGRLFNEAHSQGADSPTRSAGKT